MPKRFYLETSVIRSYFISHSSLRDLLKQKLKNQISITSNFVKMEFYRSLICNLIEFYFVLSGQASISDAIRYWNEDFHIRKIKNVNISIADVFTDINNNDINLGLLRLRNQIKILIIGFNHLINRYDKNNSKCYLGNYNFDFNSFNTEEDIEKELALCSNYFKENYIDNCNIINLLNDSIDYINKILKWDSKKASFKELQKKITKIQSNKKLSCFTCKIIGDAIISLECPSYAILLTLDTIFEDLCQILNLKFEVIPSVRTLNSLNQ